MFEWILEPNTDLLHRTLVGTGVASLVLTLALHTPNAPITGHAPVQDPTPFGRLAGATTFVSPGGFQGVTEEVAMWRAILAAPDADAVFKRLLERAATGPGQLYALAGVYYTDRQYFYTVVSPFLLSDLVVSAQLGCLYGGWRVSSLASDIERGGLAAALRGVRPLAPPVGGPPVP